MIKFKLDSAEPAGKPDWLLRKDYKKLIKENLKSAELLTPELRSENIRSWVSETKKLPIFVLTALFRVPTGNHL